MLTIEEFADEGVEFVANLKARRFKMAARAKEELIEGYRKSLITGPKFITRLIQFASINFLFGIILMVLPW